jgi:hypothetical protein
MREFKLIYQKPGFVLGPTEVPGVYNCIYLKANARYQQGAVTPNTLHICLAQVPKECIKEIPVQIDPTWLEKEGQHDYRGLPARNPLLMINKAEEGLVGVRANGTLCLDVPEKGWDDSTSVVITLAGLRNRMRPLLGD